MSKSPQLSYDAGRCVGCLECVTVCPNGAHHTVAGRHAFDHSLCDACGRCVQVCQGDAVAIIGREMKVQDVVDVVDRDRRFYERSGGGVTLSGGEPMAQFEFTLAVLQALKAVGISTCLETCGMSSWDRYAAVRPLTDLFLFDYKATGEEDLQKMTGAIESVVMGNLKRLLDAGAKVVLRCPMVPTVNATDGHLQAIARLSEQFPSLEGIELMPYHNLGVAKGERVGWTNPIPNVSVPTDEETAAWLDRLHALGCHKARLS